jgi:hypothetical protein
MYKKYIVLIFVNVIAFIIMSLKYPDTFIIPMLLLVGSALTVKKWPAASAFLVVLALGIGGFKMFICWLWVILMCAIAKGFCSLDIYKEEQLAEQEERKNYYAKNYTRKKNYKNKKRRSRDLQYQ